MNKTLLLIVFIYNAVWGYKDLSQDTLANWLKNGPPFDFVLIDVRAIGDITAMIGNDRCKPYNITWPDAFKKNAHKLLKQQHIVLYCRSGNQVDQASQYLDSLGFENVYNADGFNSWATRDASLKVKLADTMAVSQLPAVSMKALSTQIVHNSFTPQTGFISHPIAKVTITRSVNPVQSARYFTFTGRMIQVIPNQKRVVSIVQRDQKNER